MVDECTLRELFDPETAKRVVNRHNGGLNNRKGNDFETRFAVYLIAENAKKNATVADQVFELVDDLQIVFLDAEGDGDRKIDFQIKDREFLTWSELETDFSKQNHLNASLGVEPSCQAVVVSRDELRNKLRETIPEGIKSHTKVLALQNVPPNRMLMENAEAREVFKELCAFPDEPDKLESVVLTLTAAWIVQPVNQRVRIDSVIEKARTCNPAYLRVDGEWKIPETVLSIFSAIQSFTCSIEHGYFKWKYGRSMSGCLAYNCDDPKFNTFLELIEKKKPSTFDDLEPHLN